MNKYRTGTLFTEKQAEELRCTHTIGVVFESAVDTEFDYLVPDKLWPVQTGQRVLVPFGRANKLEKGFCVSIGGARPEEGKVRTFKLKKVSEVIDKKPLVDAQLMQLARWISSYYVCPLGQVLAAMVPAAVKKSAGAKRQKYIYLAEEFQAAIDRLRGRRQKQIVNLLQNKCAFDSGSAVELQMVLDELDCTKAPVKKLDQLQIIKISERTFFKSLPVIPAGLLLKAEKVSLNDDQQKALAQIKAQMESGKFGVTLLHGVTDSGKTEVYIRAIETCLQMGKSAIVILPEIALTAQTVQRFSSRFKKIAVMHSGLTGPQRNVQWQKIKAGDADVVIGARSAVFAPLSNPGLIIVDEEHEPGYKQDTQPRYNGRDVAIKRAQLSDAHCILGSATPSLETLLNCKNKKHFFIASLPKRVTGLAGPEMKLVDLKRQYSAQNAINLISEPLSAHLVEMLAKGEQAILLLNRRGYSNFVFCPSCRHSLHCRNCDVTLTFHKSSAGSSNRLQAVSGKHMHSGYAVCHYCLAKTLVPKKCPLCGKAMTMFGIGSQRLEEELRDKFPAARVARIDSDSMAGASYYRLLKDFSLGRIDILAGTQILAKGLHFPNVTVVGIISADTSLYMPDFRANERTFQLISQVAGRAGRSAKKGTVYVQTFLPEQPAIQFALKNDYDGFVREELKHRRACNLPPFWRLAAIEMRDRSFDKIEAACRAMREKVDIIVQRKGLKVKVRGPMPPAITRLHRFHRMQIIIQAPEAQSLLRLFSDLRAEKPVRPAVKVTIDIDPVKLL
ncbi:MAG: replication restart helicase PriA [Planctomycetota bacterium]|jgi:primosomal protein N' (replication factor Y)